ncbi:hypothetical protein AB0N65_13890 [Paenarthrobacter sp. NPDC089322]|uniref:hypothetical protein n=1 Tax=Paenarthrobacter sp. NPDC089322 TaxID=3155065 RepID=UPI00343FCFDF
MTFFDDLPEPPPRPRQPQPLRSGWSGPPSDELPGVVPIGEFIHNSPRMVMALKSVEVYSTGCVLDVVWIVRRGEETDREWRDVMDQGFNHPGSSLSADVGLMVGVGYPDGRKAIASRPTPSMFEDDDVTGPVLTMIGGGGGSGNDDMVQSSAHYWLWPLPLEGDTRLVAKWEGLGMDEASVVLSGEQVGEALGRVRRFWTD